MKRKTNYFVGLARFGRARDSVNFDEREKKLNLKWRWTEKKPSYERKRRNKQQ